MCRTRRPGPSSTRSRAATERPPPIRCPPRALRAHQHGAVGGRSGHLAGRADADSRAASRTRGRSTTRSITAGRSRAVCAAYLPPRGCCARPTGGSCSPSTWATGCASTLPPARSRCAASSTDETAARIGSSRADTVPSWLPSTFRGTNVNTISETGHTSWTARPTTIRLGLADDATAVTVGRLARSSPGLVRAGSATRETPTSSSSWTRATTSPDSPASWPTCPSSRSAACARTPSYSATPRRFTPRDEQPRRHGGVLSFAEPPAGLRPLAGPPCRELPR